MDLVFAFALDATLAFAFALGATLAFSLLLALALAFFGGLDGDFDLLLASSLDALLSDLVGFIALGSFAAR